jgi:redox-sensitive bicupin YhaK (pirin superfamily)
MIGKQFEQTSPVESPVQGGMLYLQLSLPASSATTITIPKDLRGLVYVLEGEALVGATMERLSKRQVGVIAPSICGSDLEISNCSTEAEPKELQVLIAAGAPQYSGPLFKCLGHGGAVFATSEATARECIGRYAANPENFGKL